MGLGGEDKREVRCFVGYAMLWSELRRWGADGGERLELGESVRWEGTR